MATSATTHPRRTQGTQPDVIVERYLAAKHYQYDPEEIYEMCEYNANAKYLAESDQIVTLTSMETDEYSIQASLNDNFPRACYHCSRRSRRPRSSIPNGSSTTNQGTLQKIQDVRCVWKKQAVKSIIVARKVIVVQESCIVI